jgi:predicted double-glycine peptidase
MTRSNYSRRRLFFTAVATTFGVVTTAASADTLQMVAPLAGPVAVSVVSMKQARYRTTVHQQYDFSCGSAAVATLLTHNYGWKVDESTVFQAMYTKGNQEKIRQEGFSMLDMKNYLDGQGFEAKGVEATLDQLADAKVPAIALINENGYSHFVVIKGLREGNVLIGDPAQGTRVISRSSFEQYWTNNILLIAASRADLARFNEYDDWRIRPRAPLEDVRAYAADTALVTMMARRSLVDF